MISFKNLVADVRLGNHLFRYAFLRETANRLGVKFYCPDWLGDKVFELNDSELRAREPGECKNQYSQPLGQPCFSDSALEIVDDTEIDGYFQSEKYYSNPAEVKNWFRFKDQAIAVAASKYHDIDFSHSVGLHLRLGDWIPSRGRIQHRYIPRLGYYKRALKELGHKQNILVFSDQMDRARHFFRSVEGNVIWMSGNTPVEDLYLMSRCRYFISSPSTLSWWGAWLNVHSDSRIIVPEEGPLRHSKRFTRDALQNYWPDPWLKRRSLLPVVDSFDTGKRIAKLEKRLNCNITYRNYESRTRPMKICFIVPFFEKSLRQAYFPAFLKTCEYNPDIHWYIFTDDTKRERMVKFHDINDLPFDTDDFPYYAGENVTFIRSSLEDMSERIEKFLPLEKPLTSAYKMCDYRLLFYRMFPEIVRDYDYWGHTDIDILYGDVSKFLLQESLQKYDIFSWRENNIGGHFTLYKYDSPRIHRFVSAYLEHEMEKFQDGSKHYNLDEKLSKLFLDDYLPGCSRRDKPSIYWKGKRIFGGKNCATAATRSTKDWVWKEGKIHSGELEVPYLHFYDQRFWTTTNFQYEDAVDMITVDDDGPVGYKDGVQIRPKYRSIEDEKESNSSSDSDKVRADLPDTSRAREPVTRDNTVKLTLHVNGENPLELSFSMDDPMILQIYKAFMSAGTETGGAEIIRLQTLERGVPTDLHIRSSSINMIKARPSLCLDFDNMVVSRARNHALVVLSIPGDSERSKAILPITLNSMRDWCNRHEIDLIHLTDLGEYLVPNKPHWERLKLGPYLDQYDRFIYIDDTCIISPDCPNLFDLVPDDALGCVVSPRQDAAIWLDEALQRYGVSHSNDQYFNAGMMVFSQVHRVLFLDIQDLVRDGMHDQDYFNAMVNKYQLPIFDLGTSFNYPGSMIPKRLKEPDTGEKVCIWHLTRACRNRHENGKKINQLISEGVL